MKLSSALTVTIALLSAQLIGSVSAQVAGPAPYPGPTPIPFPAPNPPAASTALRPNAPVDASIPLVLSWRQGGLYATWPQPSVANYFRVCIHGTAAGESCLTTAAANQWLFAASDPQIHRTLLPARPNEPFPTTYAYRFDLPTQPIPDDQAWLWTVGACRSQARDSCNHADPQQLVLSTKNLYARNIGDYLTAALIVATAEVENNGATHSGTFSTHLVILEAVIDSRGNCAKSFSSDALAAGDTAVIRSGRRVRLQSADVAGTIGVYRNEKIIGQVTSKASVAAGQAVPAATVEVSLSGMTLPAAFLMIATTDIANDVAEYDESDNVHVECHVVFPE